jgi:methionyl-tRNA formyltransferase
MTAARIVFAGTPDFALASLRALVEADLLPVTVMTQPDRPAGRGKKLTASPVKQFAVEHDIPVWQPVTLKDPDAVDHLSSLEPDLMVVAAYGLILPQAVLDVPRRGCLNVHASLLPKWRGAAPVQRSILAGDNETGVCLMQMEAGLDTGPVFACATTPIGDDESAGALHDRLAAMGGELLVAKLPDILDGRIDPSPQDDDAATYAAKLNKQEARIDWLDTAADIALQVRAYNPVPGAWFEIGEERIKCWRAVAIEHVEGPAGVVIQAGKDGIDVTCGSGALRLLEIQRPGRKRVSAAEFASQLDLSGKRFE